MTETVKEAVTRRLKIGWHTASMLAHYTGYSKSACQQAISELRKERPVRKLNVNGTGYYCIAMPIDD